MAREVRTFGEFTLDISAEQLLRGEHPVPLQRKPLRLLILLTGRPGRVVTRNEIIEALWPPNENVDFEQGLRFAVRQVRAALGERSDRTMYVETRHGVGYVFKCAVSKEIVDELESPQPVQPLLPPLPAMAEAPIHLPAPAPALPAAPAKKRQRLRFWAAAGVVAVVILLALLAAFRWHSTKQPVSLAVLPMLNLTRSGTYNDLGDDFTTAVSKRIAVLSGRQIRVVDASLADLPRQQARNAVAAAETLHTEYALSTTLQKAPVGSGLELTMEIYKVGRDDAVWTSHYDVDENHLMAAVDDLSAEMIRHLPVRWKPEKHAATYISPSREAEQAYVRGRHGFAERTQFELNAALDDFKTATRLDPSYALAHAMLAMTYEQLGSYGWMPQADARKRADEEVETALLLNPKLSEGLAARGYSKWFYHWNWKGAEGDLQEAIRSDSQNVDALHWYALVLATEGKNIEAEQQIGKALDLEPRSKILRTNLGWLNYLARNPERAATEMEAVLRDDRRFTSANLKLWAVYSQQHRYANAFQQLKLLSEEDLPEQARDALEKTYTSQGYAEAVRQWSKQQTEATRGNMLFRAELAEAAEDHQAAVHILVTAAETQDGWLLFALRDPLLHDATEDSRVKSSLKAAGLPPKA